MIILHFNFSVNGEKGGKPENEVFILKFPDFILKFCMQNFYAETWHFPFFSLNFFYTRLNLQMYMINFIIRMATHEFKVDKIKTSSLPFFVNLICAYNINKNYIFTFNLQPHTHTCTQNKIK